MGPVPVVQQPEPWNARRRVPHTPILRVGFLTFPLWRLGQAFELRGAPFGVWYFKGCGLDS